MAAVLGVLLLILKIIGIALAVVLILLLLLLILPVRVRFCYNADGITVRCGMAFITVPVLRNSELSPWLNKLVNKPKKPQQEEPPAEKKKKKQKKEKKKLKFTFEQICDMVAGAGRLMRGVFGAFRVTEIDVFYPVHCAEASDTAISYGKMQAWLHICLGILNNAMWLGFKRLQLEADYTGRLAGEENISFCLSARLIFIVIAALRFLWLLFDKKILDQLL